MAEGGGGASDPNGGSGREPADEPVLDVIGDPDCRRLLRILAREGPQSVRSLHERTGIAQSTLYRKTDLVSETPLVTAETHLDEEGRQPTRYRLAADALEIAFDDAITVSVEEERSDVGPGTTEPTESGGQESGGADGRSRPRRLE